MWPIKISIFAALASNRYRKYDRLADRAIGLSVISAETKQLRPEQFVTMSQSVILGIGVIITASALGKIFIKFIVPKI